MSAEARLSGMIQYASGDVFDEEKRYLYSVSSLAPGSVYETDYLESPQTPQTAAVLGLFAVGNLTRIERLVINENSIEDDHDLCLAQRAIEDGFDNLQKIDPLIDSIPEGYVDKVLEGSSDLFPDKDYTHLIAGIYAIKREDYKFEPLLAYNSVLDESVFYIREEILRRCEIGDYPKLNPLPKKLINPDINTRTNISISVIKEAFKTPPSEHFASQLTKKQ